MIVLLPLLRRLSVRMRLAFGLALTSAGLVLIVVAAAAAASLLVQGIVAAFVGGIFLASGSRERRRERLAHRIDSLEHAVVR